MDVLRFFKGGPLFDLQIIQNACEKLASELPVIAFLNNAPSPKFYSLFLLIPQLRTGVATLQGLNAIVRC